MAMEGTARTSGTIPFSELTRGWSPVAYTTVIFEPFISVLGLIGVTCEVSMAPLRLICGCSMAYLRRLYGASTAYLWLLYGSSMDYLWLGLYVAWLSR